MALWLRSRLPKSNFEWVLFVSALLFLAAELAQKFIFDFDPMTASEAEFFRNWIICLVRDVALIVVVSGTIITGIRKVRRAGFSWRRMVIPLLAIGFCVLMMTISGYGYLTMLKIRKALLSTPVVSLQMLEECLAGQDLSPVQRAQLSVMYARERYLIYGEIADYYTKDGSQKPYEPTDKDRQRNRERARLACLMSKAEKGLRTTTIVWPIVALVSIAIGYLSPMKREEERAGP